MVILKLKAVYLSVLCWALWTSGCIEIPVFEGDQCSDNIQNGDETGSDCGGTCTPCDTVPDNQTCETGGDCPSLVCTSYLCMPAACDDGIQNGNETGVDCGDTCNPCEAAPMGPACDIGGDCASFICVQNVCAEASCSDAVINGDETDVDCGGSCPLSCGLNQSCRVNSDCEPGSCAREDNMDSGTCIGPNCTDGVQNGLETFVDCGGTCEQGCLAGHGCNQDSDCNTGLVCNTSQCIALHCTDELQNATETDQDCGGPNCLGCGDRRVCNADSDCRDELVCAQVGPSAQLCLMLTCTDGEQGQGETDVDCGGNDCALCGPNQACRNGFDCQSAQCVGEDGSQLPDDNDTLERGTCADACANGIRDVDETGSDCGGPTCSARCGVGGGCQDNSDCELGHICQRDDGFEFGSCLPGG